jgi:SAM-dependent methyltransferase
MKASVPSSTPPSSAATRDRFVAALRPPPGSSAVPAFRDGWLEAGSEEPRPFLSYFAEPVDVNWSPELEHLHEEASRTHFIDVLTRSVAIRTLEPETLGRHPVIVDLGCSTGHLLSELEERCPDAFLVGVDAVARGLASAHAAVPRAALVHASVTDVPFGESTVDGVLALNLLEHIPDEGAVLRELKRVLRPGGRCVIVVPANPRLYDAYDAYLEHERRYARGEVARKAAESGLSARSRAYVGSLVYPGFWAVKKLNRLRYRSAPPERARDVVVRDIAATRDSRLGAFACRIEERLAAAGISLPFGIRELTVLERADA